MLGFTRSRRCSLTSRATGNEASLNSVPLLMCLNENYKPTNLSNNFHTAMLLIAINAGFLILGRITPHGHAARLSGGVAVAKSSS